MSGVPTTPTTLDKLEERRKLNLEIAKLTSAKDVAVGVAATAQEAAERAHKRATALETLVADLERSEIGAMEEIREFVADCRNTLQTVVGYMDLVAETARKLEAEIERLCEEIRKRKEELADVIATAARENEAISRKRDDLEIWEERVRSAADIHLPGVTINL